MRKLTIAYTIAILIPTIAMGSYTYYQTMENIKQQAVQNAARNLLQIKEDILRQTTIIKGVASNIAYNKNIQSLLYYGMEFTPEALNYFIDSIAAPINYALNFNGANIYQVGVYFVNETVPEYNNFYREERIRDEVWYDGFIKDARDELWIYPAKSRRFNTGSNSSKTDTDNSSSANKPENSPVVRMVKKIMGVDGSYMGIVIVDILEEDMFSSMNIGLQNNEIFIFDDNKNIVYPQNYDQVQEYVKLLKIYIASNAGADFYKNVLYSYETIEPLNIKLLSKTPIGSFVRSSVVASSYNILAVVLGVALLEVFTYFILKMIFSRLNQIVKIMSIVARGNFNIRIPIVHSDEVGQIGASFNVLIEKINTLINDVIRKETSQKDAQLTALQYQINPHFIYNTIDIFRMRLELESNYEMADSITSFGKMLRYNINRDSKYATVKEEVNYTEKYILLQKLRYGERINFAADLPEDFGDIKIIRFLLQPIVENSIKHGMGFRESLKIELKFYREKDYIEIHVIDNGLGIKSEELKSINKQLKNSMALERNRDTDKNIGLENINARIKLFYGEQYYIRLESVEGEFTKAIINIPYTQD
jgi:sensor histidine kinase YesM